MIHHIVLSSLQTEAEAEHYSAGGMKGWRTVWKKRFADWETDEAAERK